MGVWEFKAILEISLANLIFLGTTGILAGLWLNRYNRRQKPDLKEEPINLNVEVESLNVEGINKPNRGRSKKKL